MTDRIQETSVEHRFDSFCKTVLRNKARNLHKMLNLKEQREMYYEDMPQSMLDSLIHEDRYQTDSARHFSVSGIDVHVHDEHLANAIQSLPPNTRDIILLSFFSEQTDRDISECLHIPTSTLLNRKKAALSKLKDLLEGQHEQ